jgi:hypothetical protein
MIIFGVTGSGKSTIINSILNCEPIIEWIGKENCKKKVLSFKNSITPVGHT